LEAQAAYKRFDDRIATRPKFTKVIELEPAAGFLCPCTAKQVEARLRSCPKQFKSSNSALGFWGHYWQACVFLHAVLASENSDPNRRAAFYLNDVLMHEIGHHVDRRANTTTKERKRFADWFARENR